MRGEGAILVAHSIRTTERTPRLRGPNASDHESRRKKRTSHRHRSGGASRRPGAIQDLAVSVPCRSGPPSLPQPPCRTPPRRPRSPKRPTIHSIERCLASVSPRGARKSHTDDSRPRRSRPCRSSTMKYRPPPESSIRRCWVPASSDHERTSPLAAPLAREPPAHWQHLTAAEAQRRACSGHIWAWLRFKTVWFAA